MKISFGVGALLALSSTTSAQEGYTVFDDFSWAIRSQHLSTPEKQGLYDDYMHKCVAAVGEQLKDVCLEGESQRIRMNVLQPPSVRNFTKMGFEKIRAPEPLMKLLTDFWERNKEHQEIELGIGKEINSFQNAWDTPPTFVNVGNQELVGGGEHLRDLLWNHARELMSEWTGQELRPCSLYGIRVYHNQSILAPHVDRLPLITSAIINVAQEVDEPWPLEVFGHDGVARNVTMEPGDMVLYESHSIIHGRPFPMNGNFYANIFVHFEAMGPKGGKTGYNEDELPPYLVEDSPWEPFYWEEIAKKDPKAGFAHTEDHRRPPKGGFDRRGPPKEGWEQRGPPKGRRPPHPDDPHFLAHTGNLERLQSVVQENPDVVHKQDENGWYLLHESVRLGHTDMLNFLVDSGADVNAKTHHGIVPLWLALVELGEGHPITHLLKERGAEFSEPEL